MRVDVRPFAGPQRAYNLVEINVAVVHKDAVELHQFFLVDMEIWFFVLAPTYLPTRVDDGFQTIPLKTYKNLLFDTGNAIYDLYRKSRRSDVYPEKTG